jgi:nucleotide-binding universal stress UspA family protein
MSLRDILIFLDETEASEQRLNLATSIALEHGASVSGAFFPSHWAGKTEYPDGVAPSLGMMATASFTGGIADVSSGDTAEQMQERFRIKTSACRKGGNWLTFEASAFDELVAVARTADLTIVGQARREKRRSPKWRPEDIVIRCGRPVLIVPYIGNYAQVGRRVIVAWDGSREATRALNDALPLIYGASAVTLVSVYANERERVRARAAAEQMIRHLGRHGVTAHADEMAQLGGSAADILLSRSMDLSADLMVAGASHHSHWHDALFGGVSHEFFRHMTLPILMSH